MVLAHVVPRSRTAEAYRVLRSSVQFAATGTAEGSTVPDEVDDDADDADHQGAVVLVTSPSPAEGKTTTVANLAVVLGEAGARVLVVNCDFRRPSLGAYLGVDSHLAKVVDSEVDNVKVLAQVTDDPEHANPADVVALQRAVVREARRRFDFVLLDTAPLLTTNDANEVLDSADLVVLVARAGRTTREAADRCAELLERRSAPVLGLVLVATAEAPTGRYYYTGDYYVEPDSYVAPDDAPPSAEDDGGDDGGPGPGDDDGDRPSADGATTAADGDELDVDEGDDGAADADIAAERDEDGAREADEDERQPTPVGSDGPDGRDDDGEPVADDDAQDVDDDRDDQGELVADDDAQVVDDDRDDEGELVADGDGARRAGAATGSVDPAGDPVPTASASSER